MKPVSNTLESMFNVVNRLNAGIFTCAVGGATAPTQQAAQALQVECPWSDWSEDASAFVNSWKDETSPANSTWADAWSACA